MANDFDPQAAGSFPDDPGSSDATESLIDSLDTWGRSVATVLEDTAGRALDSLATLLDEQSASREVLDELKDEAARSERAAGETEAASTSPIETASPDGLGTQSMTRGEAEQIKELRNLGDKIDALRETVENQQLRQPSWGP